MSNAELLKQAITGCKRLPERRIGFYVTCGTTAEQRAEIPALVCGVAAASPRVRFARAHSEAFGDSSLDFEVVSIVLDADDNLYLGEQRISLERVLKPAQRIIELALPTRAVYFAHARGAVAPAAA